LNSTTRKPRNRRPSADPLTRYERASPGRISPTGAVTAFGKRTRKPNSVYAVIPLGAALPRALVSDLPGGSGTCSNRLGASGRGAAPAWLLALPVSGGASLPIWSCSVWGLPCLRHYYRSGALLPHLFTLTGLALQAITLRARRPCPSTRTRRYPFLWHSAVHGPSSPRPGRYPAHRPVEFGLSSPGRRVRELPAATARSSCQMLV